MDRLRAVRLLEWVTAPQNCISKGGMRYREVVLTYCRIKIFFFLFQYILYFFFIKYNIILKMYGLTNINHNHRNMFFKVYNNQLNDLNSKVIKECINLMIMFLFFKHYLE